MIIYSVNILSVCLSVMLQKALLLMDVFILVFKYLLKYLCSLPATVNSDPGIGLPAAAAAVLLRVELLLCEEPCGGSMPPAPREPP